MTTTPEFAYGSGPPKPVPPQKPEEIAQGITLLRPLSRKGHGPGLIILAPPPAQDNNNPTTSPPEIQNGIPSLRMKWAEEGYCVAQIQPHASSSSASSSSSALQIAVQALQACAECEPKEQMGIICYDFDIWFSVTHAAAALPEQIVVAAIYAHISQYQHLVSSPPPADGSSGNGSKGVLPTIYHLAGTTSSSSATTTPAPKTAAAPPNSKIYEYPSMETSSFAVPFSEEFDYATEAVSHSRNLAFVKKVMGGPYFDLELLWEEHTFYEFGSRSVENTMATMVEEPYVNHVPTLTGGIGRTNLTNFYRDHFIFSNPEDTTLELISRTVGIDRVVDEFIYKFTFTKTPDWLFPGIPPTHQFVEIPMMAVVNIRGDRLYHEHITWDHASALRQIGVLPEKLPLTITTEEEEDDDDDEKKKNKKYEITLPVAGKETAMKMRNKNSIPSNSMFEYQAREI
ncbi:uncharacterized protein SEPMUDRAFT_132709 [Sphaerulina musiva SO2202]|uniref:NTF2-like protein n=1 Tax=Sphaerulina musiva (strain SO2202) TaxID=692275 RepID=M3CI08_SPHMS|nr:uncharacterized protein SEPMUDRAFT_132709 [Sphaerulina musiva SO2202]EMF13403.1 hypothetical protein SEPMUDRAFT_132709 [Sphaerulina musiva SO2202]